MSVKTGFELIPDPIVRHLSNSINSRPSYPHIFHVSELVYCLRKAYYRRVYGGKERNVKGLWNIYRGSVLDSQWSPLFDFNQRTFIVTRRGVTITGTCDFVYDAGDGVGPVLYDLKMPASVYYKRKYGAGQGYIRQVCAYLALAHANKELLDVHRARVLMVADGVVVEEVDEWTNMLDSWLWPRAFSLDSAIRFQDPKLLMGPEEDWECNPEYCPADHKYRVDCAREKPPEPAPEFFEDVPKTEAEKELEDILY